MCLEDLKLGRGRFARAPVIVNPGASGDLLADATRVAVLVTFTGTSVFDSGAGAAIQDTLTLTGNASGGLVAFFLATGPIPPTVLRIEDLGQLITGPIHISIVSGTGFGVVTLTPICTEVQAAPAMRDYKP